MYIWCICDVYVYVMYMYMSSEQEFIWFGTENNLVRNKNLFGSEQEFIYIFYFYFIFRLNDAQHGSTTAQRRSTPFNGIIYNFY